MQGASEQDLAIASVYSESMIQLAEPLGEVENLLNELLDFVSLIEKDKDFRLFVESPLVNVEARARSFEKLFRGRYSDLFVDSLQVLNRKGRLGMVGAVAQSYSHEYETRCNRVEVYVQTAIPITDELREKIRDVAAKQTGKEPKLVESVDESLIGGLVMRVGDQKFDGSVATRLRRLGQALQDRASRELHGGRTHWEGSAI